MDTSSELVVVVTAIATLIAAALRWGAHDAIEGVGLTMLLLGMKAVRAGVRVLLTLLRMLPR